MIRHQHLGRSPEALSGALLSGRGLEVPPVWRYNAAAAQATLENLAPQLAAQPVSAGIRIVNGQVEVTPPADGRELDIVATLATLQQNPGRILHDGRLSLAIRTIPPAVADGSDPGRATAEITIDLPYAASEVIEADDTVTVETGDRPRLTVRTECSLGATHTARLRQ